MALVWAGSMIASQIVFIPGIVVGETLLYSEIEHKVKTSCNLLAQTHLHTDVFCVLGKYGKNILPALWRNAASLALPIWAAAKLLNRPRELSIIPADKVKFTLIFTSAGL